MESVNLQQDRVQQIRKAKKFSLWLGMIGMFMMFAALSSGFIVYTASGVDKGIKTLLPQTFLYSTFAILLSSVTVHLALNAAKAGSLTKQKIYLYLTIGLGVVFFWLQIDTWKILTERGVYFINNNASQSFIYVFIGLHLAHILAGLIVLFRVLLGLFKKIPAGDNVFRMDLASIFWHFLDLLWIYIYVFLLLNQ